MWEPSLPESTWMQMTQVVRESGIQVKVKMIEKIQETKNLIRHFPLSFYMIKMKSKSLFRCKRYLFYVSLLSLKKMCVCVYVYVCVCMFPEMLFECAASSDHLWPLLIIIVCHKLLYSTLKGIRNRKNNKPLGVCILEQYLNPIL